MTKTTGIILGIISIIIGAILLILGFVSFIGASSNMFDFQGVFMKAGIGMIFIFIGFILIAGGAIILYLTNIGKIFGYVAKETAPAIETTTHAVGKGLASGVKKGLKKK